jgi:predicted MFS family arabinose efflux permease
MADLRRGLIYACAFVGTLAPNALLALIPELRAYFQASTAEVLLSITFYMALFAFFSLFTGSVSDLVGRRKVLLMGLAFFAAGCALTALSADLWLFYLSRAVQGFGFAFVQPVLVAVLGDVVGPLEKGRTMGWVSAATCAGITLGPMMGGYAAAVDWRLAFLTIAIITAILAALIFALVRMPRSPAHADGGSLARNMASVLRRRPVQMLAIIGFLHTVAWIGTQAFVSDRLGQAPYLASPASIGMVLAIAGATSVLGSRAGGGMVDIWGGSETVILGNLVMMASLLLMSVYVPSIEAYATLLAIYTAGSAIAWAALLTLTVELVPSLRGTVSSVFTSLGFAGGALAPVLLSPVQVWLGTPGVHMISAGLCALVLPAVLLLRRGAKL